MKMMNQICDCGHESGYPETREGQVLCMSCAMSYDYAKAAKAKNYSLFN